ncbi:hypothetical protein HDV00_008360 [Rhizophlyctis rosea]|nr:hypothetical protein HDV00_008360 [Rhizophlyctis rosea]
MPKKTFVKQFASNLEKEHGVTAIICKDIADMEAVHHLVADSATDPTVVYLISRNERNCSTLFKDVDCTKICILIHKGNASTIDRNLQVRNALVPPQRECGVCDCKIATEGRTCNACARTTCVPCQIKLCIDGVMNGSRTYVCPFCQNREKLGKGWMSEKQLMEGLKWRIGNAYENGVVTKREAARLEMYWKEKMYPDQANEGEEGSGGESGWETESDSDAESVVEVVGIMLQALHH